MPPPAALPDPATSAPPPATGRRRAALPTLLGIPLLVLVALLLRLSSWTLVYTDQGIGLVDPDAYYHLRRVVYALLRFPELLGFDRYLAWPVGARAIWPPYLDGAVALVVRPFYALGGVDAAERAVVWIPPLLGLATLLALQRTARWMFGRRAAWTAAGLLALMPIHVWYTQLGFLDHHAAVPLLAILLVGAAARLIAGDVRSWRPALATGALAGVALLVWPGSLLHVGLVETGLILALLGAGTRERALALAERFAAAQGVALAVVLPACLDSHWPQWGDLSPVVLTRFQIWFFAVLGAFGLACRAGWARAPGAGRGRRAAGGVVVGVLLLAASALALPGLATGLGDALQWAGRAEMFQANVAESLPLFRTPDGWGVARAEGNLSRLLYLFPLAAAALAAWAPRGAARGALPVVLTWSGGLAIAALAQQRFANSFAVALCLVFGWALVAGAGWLRARIPGAAPRRAALAGAAVLLGLALAPALAVHRDALSAEWTRLHGGHVDRRPALAYVQELAGVARWIRRNTPPTSGLYDSSRAPEYGVLSLWSNGHVLNYVGQRPTVVGNFGDDVVPRNFIAVMQYLSAPSEEVGSALLDRLRVRYVLAQPAAVSGRTPGRPVLLDRLLARGGGGLHRHRLLYQDPGKVGFRLFEHVRGARLVGRAEPGASVVAQLAFATDPGLPARYRVETRADETGRFDLRVAHATRGGPPHLRVAKAYRVSSGDRVAQVVVDEDVVQRGLVVTVPSLASPTTTSPETPQPAPPAGTAPGGPRRRSP